jgi:hypothetical protein
VVVTCHSRFSCWRCSPLPERLLGLLLSWLCCIGAIVRNHEDTLAAFVQHAGTSTCTPTAASLSLMSAQHCIHIINTIVFIITRSLFPKYFKSFMRTWHFIYNSDVFNATSFI